MSNLTIIRGPAASGKTTRLRKIERDAKAKGLNVVWIEGAATDAGIEASIRHGKANVVLYDKPETALPCEVGDPGYRAAVGQVQKIAERHPDVHFAVVV